MLEKQIKTMHEVHNGHSSSLTYPAGNLPVTYRDNYDPSRVTVPGIGQLSWDGCQSSNRWSTNMKSELN